MIGGLFARRRPSPHAARLKALMAVRYPVAEDDAVLVAEVACADAGCPDVETILTVLRADGSRIERRVAKPMDCVSEADVAALAPEEGPSDDGPSAPTDAPPAAPEDRDG
jgi:hypothetical protein